jgi:hypothetical protein
MTVKKAWEFYVKCCHMKPDEPGFRHAHSTFYCGYLAAVRDAGKEGPPNVPEVEREINAVLEDNLRAATEGAIRFAAKRGGQ